MSPSRRMAGTGDTGDRELELQTKVRGDFKITEKAPIRAFSWLKALELSYLRHYAKWALSYGKLQLALSSLMFRLQL